MLNARVLCVDDEPNVGRGYARALHRVMRLDLALSGEEGLEMIRDQGPWTVVVSDMRMPRMNGVEFLERVAEISPDTMRIMLTGNIDQATAVAAINRGTVFRYLVKPCDARTFAETLIDAVQAHRRMLAARGVPDATVMGLVEAFRTIVARVDPPLLQRIERLEAHLSQLLEAEGRKVEWQMRVLPLLSQLGCLGLPAATLERAGAGESESLPPDQQREWLDHPARGAAMFAGLPRFEELTDAIAYQLKDFDGGGIPADGLAGEQIPEAARRLRLAIAWDEAQRRADTPTAAIESLKESIAAFDPARFATLKALVSPPRDDGRTTVVSVTDAAPGMVLDEAVVTHGGVWLVSKGQALTAASVERLRTFHENGQIDDGIRVRRAEAQEEATSD
jgi:response regulator RpfG family c-di-GMP phosphodiesterase